MPVYLGQYYNCASDRGNKFRRAIDSFLCQTYTDAELIIVSDGCEDSETIMELNYNGIDNVKFFRIEKQKLFAGYTRNFGISMSSGKWICYLDSDDKFGMNHLNMIAYQLDDNFEWFYYDDFLVRSEKLTKRRSVVPKAGRIGTSSIVHKRELVINWTDGYNHDYQLVKQLMAFRGKKLEQVPEYFVCHMPNVTDI